MSDPKKFGNVPREEKNLNSGKNKSQAAEKAIFSGMAKEDELDALDNNIGRRAVHIENSNGKVTPDQYFTPLDTDNQQSAPNDGDASDLVPINNALYESAPKPGRIYRVHSGGLNDFNADIDYCVKIGADGSVEGAWLEWLATKKDDSGRVTEARWANHRQRGALEADGYDVERAKAPKVIGLSDVCDSRAGSLVFVTGNPYLHWALRSSRGMTAVMPHLGYGFDDPDTNGFFKGRIPVFLSEGDRERCQTNAEKLLAEGVTERAYLLDIPERLRGRGLFEALEFNDAASNGGLVSWMNGFRHLFEDDGELGENHYIEVAIPKTRVLGCSPGRAAFFDDLELDESGRIKTTIENVRVVLQGDSALSGFLYDTFKERICVTERLPWIETTGAQDNPPREWADKDDSGLRWYFEDTYGIKSKQKIDDGFQMALMSREKHPVREYFNSLKWDGTPRLDKLLIDYWGADDNVYTREAARRHLVAAVARIFVPGTKKDEALVLVGRQGIGKSTFIRTLAKSQTGENDWFSDSAKDFGEKKDDFMELQGKLFIELGELAGLNKRDVEQVKQFLSKQSDDFRAPYGKRVCGHPRQCVFWGSTNESKFLNDSTGGRRFWPVQTHPEKAVKDVWRDLPGEVDQVWAEAVARYRNGEVLTLSAEAEAIAKREQDSRLQEDSRRGIIEEWLKKPVLPGWHSLPIREHTEFWASVGDGRRDERGLVPREYVCAPEVLHELFGERTFRADTNNTKEINRIFDSIDWLESCGRRTFRDYGRVTAFKVNAPALVESQRDSDVRKSPGIQQNIYGENSPYYRDRS